MSLPYDSIIEEQVGRFIAQKDAQIAQLRSILAERDAAIAQKDAQIAELMSKRGTFIGESDGKDFKYSPLGEQIARLESEAAELVDSLGKLFVIIDIDPLFGTRTSLDNAKHARALLRRHSKEPKP